MFTYNRAYLKSRINAKIQNRMGMMVSENDFIDEVVRQVNMDVDLSTMRRKASLVPNLFHGPMQYAAPSDMSSNGIIDIPQQAKREDGSFYFVPSEEFYTHGRRGEIAIDKFNGLAYLLINSRVDDKHVILSYLDSLTAGLTSGSWVGGNNIVPSSLVVDTDDFIKGAGSLSFNSIIAFNNVSLVATTLNPLDMTGYFDGNSSFFVYAKIVDPTVVTGYQMGFGQDATHYFTLNVTTQFDGTAFQKGWNLLKFDVTSAVSSGSPTQTNIKYMALYLQSGGTASTVLQGWKYNYLCLRRGKTADVKYYSKFGWTSAAGAYKENSTDDSDLVVAETDEIQLMIAKGKHLGLDEVSETQNAIDSAQKDYMAAVKQYQLANPSEAKIMTSEYYNYGDQNYNGTDPSHYRGGSR